MLWMVEIHAAAVEKQTELDVGSFDRCLNILGAERTKGTCNPDGWVINVSVEAADMRGAWMSAMRSIFSAGLESKLPFWPLVGVTVLDGEYAVAVGRWLESH